MCMILKCRVCACATRLILSVNSCLRILTVGLLNLTPNIDCGIYLTGVHILPKAGDGAARCSACSVGDNCGTEGRSWLEWPSLAYDWIVLGAWLHISQSFELFLLWILQSTVWFLMQHAEQKRWHFEMYANIYWNVGWPMLCIDWQREQLPDYFFKNFFK